MSHWRRRPSRSPRTRAPSGGTQPVEGQVLGSQARADRQVDGTGFGPHAREIAVGRPPRRGLADGDAEAVAPRVT